MATNGTGKLGETAMVAEVELKTIAIAGDGTAHDELRNIIADASTRALASVDFEHHEIHAGDHFYFTDSNTINAASTDAVDYLLVVPDTSKWVHFKFDADGTLITSFAMYEDCSQMTSDGYTQETAYNNNRNSSNDPALEIWSKIGSADESSDFGTKIWEYSSGLSTGNSKIPTASRNERELILGQGVKYILRVLSGSAANLTNVFFRWYEHTNES